MRNREKLGFHLVALLKACAKESDLGMGSKLHADIARIGSIRESPYVANALISMYSKCGAIDEARLVLEEMNPVVESVVSWNALVAGYAEQGRWHDTKRCIERMQNEGHLPNAVTFICILKGCGNNVGGADEGKLVHKMVVMRGLLESDAPPPPLGNALVDMYAKCGALPEAEQALEELRARNVVSWCALMGGYLRQGRASEALGCFERMGSEGVSPNAIAYVCALKACGMIGDKDKGMRIHDEILVRRRRKKGLSSEKEDVVLGTALIDMYAKCGWLARARLVLEGLAARNVVSWSALVAGYARQGHGREALRCFARMQSEGLAPDAAALVAVLRACGAARDLGRGQKLHGEIARRGLLLLSRRSNEDAVLGNALVDMYSRCGELARAEAVVLDELPAQDVVSWSCLIDGHARHGRFREALSCFGRMRSRGFRPNAVTFICVLRACGGAGAISTGRAIHAEASAQGLLPDDVALGTALVGMYASCGALADAQRALDELPVRDAVAWNAILSGYARLKRAERALECLQRMRNEAVRPDDVTFLCVLSACNRRGSPENPFACIMKTSMERDGVVPRFEHLTCMLLALGCMGRFDCAVSMIRASVLHSHHAAVAWLALLAACKLWGNAELAKLAFHRAVQLESQSQSVG